MLSWLTIRTNTLCFCQLLLCYVVYIKSCSDWCIYTHARTHTYIHKRGVVVVNVWAVNHHHHHHIIGWAFSRTHRHLQIYQLSLYSQAALISPHTYPTRPRSPGTRARPLTMLLITGIYTLKIQYYIHRWAAAIGSCITDCCCWTAAYLTIYYTLYNPQIIYLHLVPLEYICCT